MKTRIGFPALTLVVGCVLGLVLGTFIFERPPRVAFAKAAAPVQAPNDGKLRIIIFGAHPDDAEYLGAGVAMKWAKMGHHVKLVSATNGDIGHWQMAGGPLAEGVTAAEPLSFLPNNSRRIRHSSTNAKHIVFATGNLSENRDSG